MTIFELSRPVVASRFRNERPFVYSMAPGDWETADYWTSAFGAPAESSAESMHIGSFFRDGVNRYGLMASFLAVLAQERSFWWGVESSIVSYAGIPVTYAGVVVTDGVSRQARLYVHLEHDEHILGPVYQYGKTQGFCKEQALYIDDIFYSPVLESIPSLSQEQDLEAYDALAFISGAAVFKNANGDLDWMIDTPPFGYECSIARLALEKGVRGYTRADLTYRAALYVEDFSASLSKTTLNLQDRRKAQNIKVPTELLSAADYPNLEDNLVDKPVPLLYGTVAALTPVLLNGKAESGAVEYLIAPRLVSMGTVQVKKTINEVDTWVTVTPATIDLATGIFTLSAANGRDDKTPYDCRVLAPEGPYGNPLDVIKDLNTRYLGSQYLEGEYDLTEWAAAEAALDNIGIYVPEQTELYELIRKLQNGSVAGFRYEYRPDGRRTARIDDWDRAPAYRIAREDIADIEGVEVETDSDLLAASIKILYAHDYAQDKDSEKIDVSKKTAVQLAYRQEPQLEFETLLQTESLAAECAALKADRYSVARMIASLEVLGSEFLALRIYDVVVVELVPRGYDADSGALVGTRRWVGVWKAIVLSIDPDISRETNKVSLALIANITDVVPVLVTETSYLDAGDGTPLILGQ